jgi:glucose-6-phosphate dehydrogenase assembly protein OpcA
LRGRYILEELERSRCTVGTENAAPAVATLNFIVYVDDPAYEDWVLERAIKVVEKYPARLLILDANDSSNEANIKCLAGAGSTVATECVDLAIGGLEPQVIRSLVEELMIPQLPTMLWWSAKELGEHPVLRELVALASKIVIDSSGDTTGDTTLAQLSAFHAANPNLVLEDLAWMRLAPWQEMIAQFFDDETLRGILMAPQSLEIDAGSRAEAIYLAGWMASRLGWSVTSPASMRTRDGADIALTVESHGEPRRVYRIAMASGGSRCTAELGDDLATVKLEVTGAGSRPPWFVPLANVRNLELLERFILTNATDEIFEASLRSAGELVAR